MSMSISQVCKVLDRAGVKYMRSCKLVIDVVFCPHAMVLIMETRDGLVVDIEQGMATFKFNSLAHDEHNLYFSYKGESPLVVKIK